MENKIKTKQDVENFGRLQYKIQGNYNSTKLGNATITDKQDIDKILIYCKNPIIKMNKKSLLYAYNNTFKTNINILKEIMEKIILTDITFAKKLYNNLGIYNYDKTTYSSLGKEYPIIIDDSLEDGVMLIKDNNEIKLAIADYGV